MRAMKLCLTSITYKLRDIFEGSLSSAVPSLYTVDGIFL